MYKIKQIPSDFIVKEINTLHFDENGAYSYYLLKKRDYNTVDAIAKICSYLNIDEKRANFAGNKDKAAKTEQYISINHGPNKCIVLNDIELKFLGQGNERLNLGCLLGNEFEIVVRNIEKKPKPKKLIINYFDEQRFGKNNDNQTVGKLILKERYDEACKMISGTDKILKEKPNDFIAALRNIPKKVLTLYVHAYQSFLWNRSALEISKTKKTNIKLPIIGFGTEFSDKKIKKIYEKIMKDEGITFRDFVNKKIPELSDEGTDRDLYVMPEKLKIGKLEDDELNPEMKKVKIRFFLKKGAYATNVIKAMFKE